MIDDARRRRDRARQHDRAVHRRGAPLLPDPAGRAARRRRGPASCCWSPRPPRTRRSRWSPRCCPARWCCSCSRSPTTTCASWSAARSPTRAASAARSTSSPTPRTRWCGWPPATPGGPSPRWRPPPTGCSRTAHRVIDVPAVERAVTEVAVRYDRAGDQHYDVISAFIKSIRGSDPDAALHYLARMIVAGEDPRFIARRLIVHASEDVGLADPTALPAAVAAAQAVQLIGHARGPARPGPGHRAPRHRTEVQRGDHRDRRGDGRRAGRRGRRGAGAPARRALRGRAAARATRSATATRTTSPTACWPSSTRPTSWSAATTTDPPAHGAERALAERLPKLRRTVRGS